MKKILYLKLCKVYFVFNYFFLLITKYFVVVYVKFKIILFNSFIKIKVLF